MSTAPTTKVTTPSLPPPHGPWPAYGLWSRRWPPAGRPAGAPTVAAVAAAAAVAALALPLDRPGLGWPLTALAGVAAALVIRTVPDRGSPNAPRPLVVVRSAVHPGPDRLGWAGATMALVAVGAFRSAGWLFLLCLATAVLTGALALTGGRSTRGIAAGCTIALIAAFRAVPWLTRGAARMRRSGGARPTIRIVATVAVSVALLTVFGALFASAEPAFADALASVAPDPGGGTVVRVVFVFVLATMVFGGAVYLRALPPNLTALDGTEGRKVTRLEWAVPLGLLVVLFAVFVTVQLTVLFGGDRHVRATDGLTYAGYARGGFWQLSFATGLTLLVLAGAARWAPRRSAADRLLIRVLLGALAGLTLVIVGSALHRIGLYADTYGLTRLRLLVACCEAWFGLVLILVLAAGVRLRAPWLPRVAVATGVAALLGLAAANPDGLIAAYNIRQDRTIDVGYLRELSPDAAPALAALDPARRDCVLGPLADTLQADDWRGWNLGREQARAVLIEERIPMTWRCS